MKKQIYISKPIVEKPLLDTISKPALIAWFRCDNCFTCRFREEVLDPHPTHGISWCSGTHERFNTVDIVEFLGYDKQ